LAKKMCLAQDGKYVTLWVKGKDDKKKKIFKKKVHL